MFKREKINKRLYDMRRNKLISPGDHIYRVKKELLDAITERFELEVNPYADYGDPLAHAIVKYNPELLNKTKYEDLKPKGRYNMMVEQALTINYACNDTDIYYKMLSKWVDHGLNLEKGILGRNPMSNTLAGEYIRKDDLSDLRMYTIETMSLYSFPRLVSLSYNNKEEYYEEFRYFLTNDINMNYDQLMDISKEVVVIPTKGDGPKYKEAVKDFKCHLGRHTLDQHLSNSTGHLYTRTMNFIRFLRKITISGLYMTQRDTDILNQHASIRLKFRFTEGLYKARIGSVDAIMRNMPIIDLYLGLFGDQI